MRNKKFIKWILIALVLLILSISTLYFITKEDPVVYMSAQAKIMDIEQKVYATGTLTGKVAVDVGAQVSGQIKKLYVNNGDIVKQGDLLAEIDPEIQINNLRRAEAEEKLILAQIASKDAQLQMLKAENIRQNNLLKTNATSEQNAQRAKAEYLMAKADLDALKAKYEQAKISVDDAKTNLAYTKIVAPMDGTVYAIPVEEGQTVNANQTTPTILKLAQLSTMTVEAQISEADVVKVSPGMHSKFTIMGLPNRYFDAVLTSIDPAPASAKKDNSNNNNNSNTEAIYYNALLDVDNKDALLRISMTAEVEITIASVKNVTAIPLSAIQDEKDNGRATIYQIEEDMSITPVKVKLGVRDEQYVQVLNADFDMSKKLVIGDDIKSAAQKAKGNGTKRKHRSPSLF